MKKLCKKLTFILAIGLLLTASCSKDDALEDQPDEVQITGEVSRAQLVTVDLPNVNLYSNEYPGVFDGAFVTLIKSGDNKLQFLVPYKTNIGKQTLLIPSLNNLSIVYNIKDAAISGTPDEVMADFFTNLENLSLQSDSSPEGLSLKNSLNTFNNEYAKASAQEKLEMAVLYKTNKVEFDKIFAQNLTGKISGSANTAASVIKHTAGVAIMAGGCVLLAASSPGLGLVLVASGAYLAYKANAEVIDNTAAAIGAAFAGFLGQSDKKLAAVLTLNNDISTKISFDIIQRKIIQSDRDNKGAIAQEYFKAHDQYNFYANKDNIEIEKYNDKKGTNYGLITLEELPATAAQTNNAVNAENFKNIKLTLEDSNLVLVSAVLETDGQLNIKVKIAESSSASVVESFLNYTYEDGFSKMSGKLPIKVVRSLVGTWKLESFDDGILPGQYGNFYHEKCQSIIYEKYSILSQTMTFTESTVTETSSWNYILLNKVIDVSTCAVTLDSPDTQWSDTTSTGGTYKFDNGVLEVNGEDGLIKTSVTFISGNKIKIDDDIFVRQ